MNTAEKIFWISICVISVGLLVWSFWPKRISRPAAPERTKTRRVIIPDDRFVDGPGFGLQCGIATSGATIAEEIDHRPQVNAPTDNYGDTIGNFGVLSAPEPEPGPAPQASTTNEPPAAPSYESVQVEAPDPAPSPCYESTPAYDPVPSVDSSPSFDPGPSTDAGSSASVC